MRQIWVVVAIGCGSSSGSQPDAPAVAAVEDVVTGLADPHQIAVDGAHVYVAHGAGDISRVPKAGGAIAPITTGQRGPTSLDASTDRLCWVNTGTHAADFVDGSVRCAGKAGGNDQTLASSVLPSGLAIDGTTMFWVEVDGQRVRSIGMDGAGEMTLDASPTHKTAIAITADRLAWTASGETSDVVTMNRATGEKTTLSTAEYSPSAVEIVGADVYWLVRHSLSDSGALRVARDGGAPADVVSDEYHPLALVQAGGSLYWTSDGRVRAIAATGGTALTLVSDRGTIGDLATDGEYLYWTEPDRGAIVRMRR